MKSDFDEESPNNTCPSFWQMIWETKSKLIVMLCEVTPGFTGCSEYFPMNQGESVHHGKFLIKNTSKHVIKDGICHRVFELETPDHSMIYKKRAFMYAEDLK